MAFLLVFDLKDGLSVSKSFSTHASNLATCQREGRSGRGELGRSVDPREHSNAERRVGDDNDKESQPHQKSSKNAPTVLTSQLDPLLTRQTRSGSGTLILLRE